MSSEQQVAMPRVIERRVAFETPWFNVTSKTVSGLSDNPGPQQYWVVEPADYVAVFALTREKDLVLVRQYRPVTERTMLELPSGHVDAGEEPVQAARRELAEETGFEAEAFTLLGVMSPDCGRLGNRLWGFLALNAERPTNPMPPEPGVEVVLCRARDAFKLAVAGEIDHALNLAVMFLAMARYGQSLFGTASAEVRVPWASD
jgi:ADP-ribose pyrophosphatase